MQKQNADANNMLFLALHDEATEKYLSLVSIFNGGTINIKINDTSQGVYLPISKLHSILAVRTELTCP